MSIRILLADNERLLRQLLRNMLQEQPDMEVVGEAGDGREALELVRQLTPDIVIMDVTMPNLNGIDATRQINREFPKVKVTALSVHSNTMFVVDMLKAGALGYVLKDSLFDELAESIRTVSSGGKYLSPKIAGKVVDAFIRGIDPTVESTLKTLSTREREVLQLIAEGKSTKEIALQLHVSSKAIEANRRKIMDKLDARSIAELVKIAILGGLTSLES
jgi:DNA-binding NarL/FixJ family response regulator